MKTIEQNDMISSEKDSGKEKKSKTERLLFLFAICYAVGYAPDFWANMKSVSFIGAAESTANYLLIIPFILITALVIGILAYSFSKKDVYFSEAGKLAEIYRDMSENETLTVSNIEKISFYNDTKGYINYMICTDESGNEYRFPISKQDWGKLFNEKCDHSEKGFRAEYLKNSHIITDYTFEASTETQE